jgi:hypothetical protein
MTHASSQLSNEKKDGSISTRSSARTLPVDIISLVKAVEQIGRTEAATFENLTFITLYRYFMDQLLGTSDSKDNCHFSAYRSNFEIVND